MAQILYLFYAMKGFLTAFPSFIIARREFFQLILDLKDILESLSYGQDI